MTFATLNIEDRKVFISAAFGRHILSNDAFSHLMCATISKFIEEFTYCYFMLHKNIYIISEPYSPGSIFVAASV